MYMTFVENGRFDVRPQASDSTDKQKWKVKGNTDSKDLNTYSITNVSSGHPLSFREDAKKDGSTILRISAFEQGRRWTIEPRGHQFVIGWEGNEQCIDYANSGTDDWLVLWNRNNQVQQRWVLEAVTPGVPVYIQWDSPGTQGPVEAMFTNVATSTVLSCNSVPSHDNASKLVHCRPGEFTQFWRLENEIKFGADKWAYTMRNVQTNQYLCAKPAGQGQPVVLLDSRPQQESVGYWAFEKCRSKDNRTFDVVIHSIALQKYVLDLEGARKDPQAQILSFGEHKGNNQRWAVSVLRRQFE